MPQTESASRTAATLATVDPGSTAWIQEVDVPPHRDLSGERGSLRRGRRLRCLRRTRDHVFLELPDGEEVTLSLADARQVKVLGVIAGDEGSPEDRVPSVIGDGGGRVVHWIGGDPASPGPVSGGSDHRASSHLPR